MRDTAWRVEGTGGTVTLARALELQLLRWRLMAVKGHEAGEVQTCLKQNLVKLHLKHPSIMCYERTYKAPIVLHNHS